MYIKRYTIAALLLIFAIGWFVYGFVSKESVHITVMGIVLPSLPIAVWVALAMAVLYVATLTHMLFYSVVGSIRLRKYEKDFTHLLEAIADAFLQKSDRKHAFRTDRYSLLGEVVDQSQMQPAPTLAELPNPKLAEVVKTIETIHRGEGTDLKRYNLGLDNPLVRQNQVNLLEEGKLEAEDVLAKPERYHRALHAMAFERLCTDAPLHVLEKYRDFITFKGLLIIVSRINAEEHTLSIPNTTLVDFMEKTDGLSSLDYLYVAVTMGRNMLPEQRISIMEKLSDDDEKALDGYLFTLFDLEMIDKANELLHITSEEEYPLYKAYADLKACSKHYDIKRFAKMMLLNYVPKS